jgi:hypothetical protein
MPRGDKSNPRRTRGTVNRDDGAAKNPGPDGVSPLVVLRSVARSFESKSATAKKTASARRRQAAEAAHS